MTISLVCSSLHPQSPIVKQFLTKLSGWIGNHGETQALTSVHFQMYELIVQSPHVKNTLFPKLTAALKIFFFKFKYINSVLHKNQGYLLFLPFIFVLLYAFELYTQIKNNFYITSKQNIINYLTHHNLTKNRKII